MPHRRSLADRIRRRGLRSAGAGMVLPTGEPDGVEGSPMPSENTTSAETVQQPARLSEDEIAQIRRRNSEPTNPGPCPVCGAERIIRIYQKSNGCIWACGVQLQAGATYDPRHYRASVVEQVRPSDDAMIDGLLAEVDALRAELAASRASEAALSRAVEQCSDVLTRIENARVPKIIAPGLRHPFEDKALRELGPDISNGVSLLVACVRADNAARMALERRDDAHAASEPSAAPGEGER